LNSNKENDQFQQMGVREDQFFLAVTQLADGSSMQFLPCGAPANEKPKVSSSLALGQS
jgi:hypothetical protein